MIRSFLLVSFLASFLSIGTEAAAQTKFSGTTMGPIEYNVVVYDELEDAAAVRAGIQTRLDEVNQLMSTYIESSDVSRVNQAQQDVWVPVSVLTLQVVDRAIQISEQTSGAFDVTVGPAVSFWKFGAESKQPAASVEELRRFVGYRNLKTRTAPPAIQKSDRRTQIDLSAIAKGFAVDRVAQWLREQTLTNFMVEVGGEVFASGKTPKGHWRIGIENPQEFQRSVASVALLTNVAMATSGDYRNFRIENGIRISHTIDPVTCQPVANETASVSIVAKDCLTADAVATAVMAMGAERGIQYCRSHGIEYAIMQRRESGFELIKSDRFPIDLESTETSHASIWPAFVGAVIVFSLAIAGMAVGAVFNNKPITGSCGGIAATQNEDGSSSCSMCHKPVTDCPERSAV